MKLSFALASAVAANVVDKLEDPTVEPETTRPIFHPDGNIELVCVDLSSIKGNIHVNQMTSEINSMEEISQKDSFGLLEQMLTILKVDGKQMEKEIPSGTNMPMDDSLKMKS